MNIRARLRRKQRQRRILAGAILVLSFAGVAWMRHSKVLEEPEVSPEPTMEEMSAEIVPVDETPAPTARPTPTAQPTPTPTPEPEPEHVHVWGEVYSVRHYSSEGHWETVTVKAAWDEPKTGRGYICGVCGASFGDAASAATHIGNAHGHEGIYYQGTISLGSIHHDAVTEQRWVEDSPAHDDSVLTGYICEICGEERSLDEPEPQSAPPGKPRPEGWPAETIS